MLGSYSEWVFLHQMISKQLVTACKNVYKKLFHFHGSQDPDTKALQIKINAWIAFRKPELPVRLQDQPRAMINEVKTLIQARNVAALSSTWCLFFSKQIPNGMRNNKWMSRIWDAGRVKIGVRVVLQFTNYWEKMNTKPKYERMWWGGGLGETGETKKVSSAESSYFLSRRPAYMTGSLLACSLQISD